MSRWGGRAAQALTALVLITYGDVCHLCGRPGATTADHLVPRSRGGDDSLGNLRPAHGPCNSARQDMTLAEWFRRHPLTAPDTPPPSRDWCSPASAAGPPGF
ncbi:HNH endonuclease [Gordonia phage Schiebs]|nr:HNH endonuclease [Gordonia phage Schiebs]